MADKNSTAAQKMSTEEYRQKKQEQKEQMAESNDSIFWLTFCGRKGYAVKKMITNIDRQVSNIRRRASNEESIVEAKDVLKTVESTAEGIWGLVTEAIPRLHTVSYDKCIAELNNSKAEKRQLAKLSYSLAILPRSTEVGYLAMAVKKFEERGRELQQTDLDALNILIKKYGEAYEKMSELESSLASVSKNN